MTWMELQYLLVLPMLIYYNPADPALWVEKRMGIGWMLNFGNTRSWYVMGGILLFAVAVPMLSIFLGRH